MSGKRNSSRRTFLQQVLTGMGAFSIPNIARLRAAASNSRRAKDTSIILLWQDGGPSHFETFDPKPDAPAEIRGDLDPISTKLPGIQFCEVLPQLAKIADRYTIIRSLRQASSGHVSATHTFVTGYDRTGTIKGPPANPDFSSVISFMRAGQNGQVPNYVGLPEQARGGQAYLGPSYGPLRVKGDPSQPDFKISQFQFPENISRGRILQRSRLLSEVEQVRRSLDSSKQFDSMDHFRQQAYDLVVGKAAEAFDLSREDPKLRERYGMHQAGQQALLARRLVEAGVSVVTVRCHPPGPWHDSWDDHPCGTHVFGTMRGRGPLFDQTVSALIEDLGNRGLDEKVLLVVAGEFGRTPTIRNFDGVPGRDHWGHAGCALVYGGGMQMGQVIGATNPKGERPSERPIVPQDLLATIYHFLGIDPHHMLVDPEGRPLPILPHGTTIPELLG